MLKTTRWWGKALTLSAGLMGAACGARDDSDDPVTKVPKSGHLGDPTDLEVQREEGALRELERGGVRVQGGGREATKLAGSGLGRGSTPRASAESFVKARGAALRLDPADLSHRLSPEQRGATHVPVLFDRSTGKYKFTRVSYGQERDGIPVYGSRVDVLVRNDAGAPVVLATSTARSLGKYRPTLRGVRVDAQKARLAVARDLDARDWHGPARQSVSAGLDTFSRPETVVWAGTRAAPAQPRVAVTYVAESSSGPEKWRIVADAETGDVLHKENLVVYETVSGSVSGEGTSDHRAPECSSPALHPLAYAELASAESSSFADEAGAFALEASGGTPVALTSTLSGTYFVVHDALASRDLSLSQTVSAPGVVDFVHEAADEYALAQINGYLNANQVRNWVLAIHPSFPTIADQTGFPVNVNETTGACPGNAWYDYSSINFCASSATYGNTSFASVNFHEYGHHLVASAGSGQGAYGEGMADVVAMLIADDPGLGYGFYKDQCTTPLRSADNDCQFSATGCSSCGSESHACGKLLSGAIWDIREALALSDPESSLELLSNLTVSSILLHSGTKIDEQIAIDFLTLDDDDGNIANGTPHRSAICSGFGAHGIECPELSTGLQVSPEVPVESVGEPNGPFTPEAFSYTLENLGPDPLDFTAAVDVPWLSVDVGAGSLAVGETRDILVSVTSGASSFERGVYAGAVHVEDVAHPENEIVLPVTLRVGQPSVKYSWDLDVDPGWQRDAAWEFGQPLGQGGTHPDPTSGATGTNVFGYNLAGNYESNLSERHLTTSAIDCSNLSDVSLRFQRWLNIESNAFDHAWVRVSTDGSNWTSVWENGGNSLFDSAWTAQEIDISSIADGQPTVFVRFTMGTTDGVVQYSGWNLDDIEIWGYGEPASECDANTDCDDGSFCNGAEACVAGACVSGTPVVCDDGVACTSDICNEQTDSCEASVQHSLCDDGVFCNGVEQCTLAGCEAGSPPVCDDGIGCTADTCDPGVDACTFAPEDALCENGVFCDGAEICSATLGCVDGPDPCPSGSCEEATLTCACVDVSYEAEEMVHSTGGATPGGWNIWSNGYVETSHEFLGGTTTLSIVAAGDYAAGWPHMVVSVDGVTVGEVDVDASSWETYAFTFEAQPGNAAVRIAFDNDYNGSSGDRNLKVDRLTVVCGGSTGPTPSCSDGAQNGSETDVDCGGSCSGCGEGQSCSTDADCAAGGCESGACTTSSSGEVTAAIRIDNDWGGGYCGTVVITNDAAIPTTGWLVEVDLQGTSRTGEWSGVYQATSGGFTVSNLSWNGVIAPGGELASTGFCAARNGGSAVATVLGVSPTF